MQKRLESRIAGRVQGVMYRDFVRRTAQKLDLVGSVNNNDDGSVSVVAEGDEENLKALLAKLHQGPALARVEEVTEEWSDANGEFDDFRILL